MVILKIIVIMYVTIHIKAQTAIDLPNVDVSALDEIFNATLSVVNYAIELYNFAEDLEAEQLMRQRVIRILDQVNAISKHLEYFQTHLEIKLDAMLNTLIAEVNIVPNLDYSKRKLCHNINRINHYFDKAREFTFNKLFDNDTLQRFGDSALWSGDNLPDVLENLHDLMVPSLNKPGFVANMLKQSHIKQVVNCNIQQSAQQRMYYTLVQVTVAEMKGLAALEQIIILQKTLDTTHDYNYELSIMKKNYQRRMKTYYKIMSQSLKSFPRDIRRCEPPIFVWDVNYMEMTGFSRSIVHDKNHKRPECQVCPTDPGAGIYNCFPINVDLLWGCAAAPGSRREFINWKDNFGVQYGPDGECSGGRRRIDAPDPQGLRGCKICICSEDKIVSSSKYDGSLWHISLTDQIADMHNNMVVTGIRFVRTQYVLHLQIQQGNFSQTGVIPNWQSWKPVDFEYSAESWRLISKQIRSEPLLHHRNTIYLDDIMVPDNCVVTGVRFRLVNDVAFMLQVLATEYDFTRNELIPYASQWIDATTHPAMPKEYSREREEIIMGASDNPTNSASFQYDSGSNKKVAFIHTDLRKDAGQTTIPLIDKQEVAAKPAFPLGGIGLSFRGRREYGGFIAPRIYTIDTSGYSELPEFTQDIKTKNIWSCKRA